MRATSGFDTVCNRRLDCRCHRRSFRLRPLPHRHKPPPSRSLLDNHHRILGSRHHKSRPDLGSRFHIRAVHKHQPSSAPHHHMLPHR